MIEDPEIVALDTAYTALKKLAPDAIARNMNWLATRLGVPLPAKSTSVASQPSLLSAPLTQSQTKSEAPDKQVDSNEISSFETSGEFLSTFHELTEDERVLAVAAYLQKKEPETGLTGFSINKELKNIGHGLKNITRAINAWVGMRPQMMIQIRKSGTTRQAKKVYKVTEEGFKSVAQLINKPLAQP